MPADSTPLMRARLSVSNFPECGLNSLAPSLAKAIFWPAATFGAPHTTVAVPPSPVSTMGRLRRSAFGCWIDLQHVPDDDLLTVPVAADYPDFPYLDPGHRELVGKLMWRVGNGYVILEPGDGY